MSILWWGSGAAPAAPAAPAVGAEAGAPRTTFGRFPRIVFTLDGSPVDLADWSFSSSADLGFDQFRAIATNARARKIIGGVQQGSVIEAFTETGRRVWEGTVPDPPKLRQDGLAQVAAQGYAYRAAKSGNRITPIIDAPGAWIPANLEPINYPMTESFSGTPVITNTIDERSISFQTLGTGNEIGFGFYAKGMNITRFEATFSAPGVATVWRVITGQLPNVYETRRIEAVFDSSGAASGTGMGTPMPRRREFGAAVEFAPSDVIIVELFRPVLNLAGGTHTITDPKVWGDYDTDVVYTDQAARVVARQLGWDPAGVTGRGAAPLTSSDWVGDGASYMSYISGLEDFCWGVWDDTGYGPLLTYGPYGRKTWEVSASTGATWDLDPLERIRRITVQYLNIDGTLNEVSLDAPDASNLPEDVASELKGSLVDTQSERALASITAWRLLQRFLQARYRGRVSLVHAFEEGSRRDAAYEVRGGDLIKITDFSLDGSITLRVHDVEYTPNGVVVGIEAPALPLGGSIRGSASGIRAGVAPTTTVTGGAPVYVVPGQSAGSGGGGNDTVSGYPGPYKGGIDLGGYGK